MEAPRNQPHQQKETGEGHVSVEDGFLSRHGTKRGYHKFGSTPVSFDAGCHRGMECTAPDYIPTPAENDGLASDRVATR